MNAPAGGPLDAPALPDAPVIQSGPAAGAPATRPTAEAGPKRGLTIRLKLTLWYGCLFLLGGVILIAANYFMVRDSLAIAPEKARAAVAEQFGLDPRILEFAGGPGPRGEMERYITINGIPLPRLLDEAQRELKEEALRQLWTRSVIALAIMAVIVFAMAWLLAGRMLRPLHAITNTARRLSGSTLHERINLRGPRDELKELADTFDSMLGRLDIAFTAQKEFVANASHELRTPLTIIRTEVDVALSDPDVSPEELQEMGAAITEAVGRSEGLIDGLLVLASADGRPTLTDLDLAEIAENEVDLSSADADSLGLRLELDLEPAPVRGEPALIERMVGNLVENAIRHNLPDGWFSVKTGIADGWAVLRVANSGAIMPQEELERLFERFYRPDRSAAARPAVSVRTLDRQIGGHRSRWTVQLTGPAQGGLEVTVLLPAGIPAAAGPPPVTNSN
jgi:signal transduction histidine kinase